MGIRTIPSFEELLSATPPATDDVMRWNGSLWVPMSAASAAEIATLDGGAESAGTSDTYARGDHKHAVEFGAFTSYTPEWTANTGTAPAIGNGSLTGWYLQLGKLLVVYIDFQPGTTTNYGDNGNQWRFHLPAGMQVAANGIRQVGPARVRNVGIQTYRANAEFGASLAYCTIQAQESNAVVGKTNPFTWTNTPNGNLTVGPVLLELA